MKLVERVCRVCRQTQEQVHLTSMETAGVLDTFAFTIALPGIENWDQFYKMCDPCLKLLVHFEQYKKMCIETDNFFRENLYTEVKIEYSEDPLESVSDHKNVQLDNSELLGVKKEEIELEFKSSPLEIHSNAEVEYSCPHCDKKFKYSKCLSNHQKRHKKAKADGDIKIKIVKEKRTKVKKVKDVDDAESDEKSVETNLDPEGDKFDIKQSTTGTHKGEKIHQCDICQESFSFLSHLRKHILRRHDKIKSHQCSMCEKKFLTKYERNQHQIIHRTERPFICEQCPAKFKSTELLRRHIKRHGKSKSVHHNQCQLCSEYFSDKISLRNHVVTHLMNRTFECKICNLNFDQLSHLRAHVKDEHPKLELNECIDDPNVLLAFSATINQPKPLSSLNKDHVCYICGKGFTQSNNLLVHIRRHTGEKPCKCDKCGICFVDLSQLSNHQRRKHGEKRFRCDHCAYTASTVPQMTKHMRSHLNDTPYSCDLCDASYKRAESLTIHRRTHTGEKPYSCTYCDKAFISLDYLKQHLVTHTGERRFECKICSKKFTQRTPLKKHMMLHGS